MYHVGKTSADVACFDVHVSESCGMAKSREGLGLLVCPPVTGKAGGAGSHLTLDHKEPPTRSEHSTDLGEARGDIRPVMHGRDRPHNGRRMLGQRQGFRAALRPGDVRSVTGHASGQPQHQRRRIHPGDARGVAGRRSDGSAGAATDIDRMVRTRQAGHIGHQTSTLTREGQHAERDQKSYRPGKSMAIGMVIDRNV